MSSPELLKTHTAKPINQLKMRHLQAKNKPAETGILVMSHSIK